jgi:hypothetical protein
MDSQQTTITALSVAAVNSRFPVAFEPGTIPDPTILPTTTVFVSAGIVPGAARRNTPEA